MCLALALGMVLAGVPAPVFGAAGFTELRSSSLVINDQMTLFQGLYYNNACSANAAENYLVYEPGTGITPVVSYGNDVYGAAGISRIYEIEEQSGRRLVAASNGDYFNMATGVSLGAVIKDGILRTGEHSKFETIGFFEDGSVQIGRMNLQISVQDQAIDQGFSNVGYNKALTQSNGIVMFTKDFGPTNEAAFPTRNLLIDIGEGTAVPGGTIRGTVLERIDGMGKLYLAENQILLSIAADSPYASALDILGAMMPGDEVAITFACDDSWYDVVQAVGAEKRLVTNGQCASFTDTGRAPRTAMGIRDDGSVVLYTVDGRQEDHSLGMTFAELAVRMQELGCRDAVNLDGGDSTMLFATYPGYETRAQVNQSSGTALRRCGNYILFENNRTPSSVLRHLHVYPHDLNILAGSSVPLEVRASDAAYYYVKAPGSGVTFSVSAKNLGTVSGEGIFQAGSRSLTGSVDARYGAVTGSASVAVIDSPDSVSLVIPETGEAVPDHISVAAGESFALSAEATHNTLELISDPGAYAWTVEGDIGTVDEKGLFTATTTGLGTGIVTASAGGRSDSVKVTIVTEGQTLETFEDDARLVLSPGSYGGLTAAVQTNPAYVHNGRKSLELDYQYDLRIPAAATEEATGLPEALAIPLNVAFTDKSPTMFSAWVYGNGSKEAVSLAVETGQETLTLTLTELDHQGWKLAYVQLPDGVRRLEGLGIREVAGSSGSGTVYLDQFMAGYGYYLDTNPPVIQADVSESMLTGTVADELDAALSASGMAVTYDGKAIPFDYSASNKSISAPLPQGDGYEHRVVIRATDKSGNIGRLSFALLTDPAGEDFVKEAVFGDMPQTHWATPFAEYLYRQGILTGRMSEQARIYDPDKTMTRQEFAAVMVRWLGIDPRDYEDKPLTFADASAIQAWALNSVRAAVEQGFMTGKSVSGSSRILFDPSGPISRQEVMTVIGRVQEKGYPQAEMNFSDAGRIAPWALPYVSTLVGQKVVSGFDGKLDPTGNVTRAQIAKMISELN